MSIDACEALSKPPAGEDDAVAWIEFATRLIGPKFDPSIPFEQYSHSRYMDVQLVFSDEELAAVSSACLAALRFLGDRASDIAYRTAIALLGELDSGWRRWARPTSSPSPRFWRVDRPDLGDPRTGPDPARGLAYEDESGTWWIWDPATEALHNDTPWLFTDFYYRANARRSVVVSSETGALRFALVPAGEVRALIAAGAFDGPSDGMSSGRRGDDSALRLDLLVPQAPS